MQRDNADSELKGLGWLFLLSMIAHILMSVGITLLDGKGLTLPVEVSLVISELTILIPSAIYILIKRSDFKTDLGFRPIKAGSVLMCVLLSVLVTPLASFVNVLSQLFVENTMVQMSDSLTGGSNAIVLFLAAVYGPFCEEFMFRSIFARGYGKHEGPMRAALISALFFALAHMNVNQAAYAFVLGVVFAIVNKAADSVYPSIILHICVNGANMLLLFVMTAAAKYAGDGVDLAESAEAARKGNAIYVLLGVTLIGALISTAIAVPCVVWLSKHEGRFEGLKEMFTVKHERKNWINVPTVLALLIMLFVMFGLDPVLSALG